MAEHSIEILSFVSLGTETLGLDLSGTLLWQIGTKSDCEIRNQTGWGSDSNREPKCILSLFSSIPQKCLTFLTSPEERRKDIFVSNEYCVN